MDSTPNTMAEVHQEQGSERIDKLQKKIDTTRYNMAVSKEIIEETPSNAQQEKLIRKNIRRQHGISGIEKEIRDIEQALEE